MSILIRRDTRILVQGITGGQASVDTERGQRYGARILAGVTPGRGGERVHGVPVYDTVAEAARIHRIDATGDPASVQAQIIATVNARFGLMLA